MGQGKGGRVWGGGGEGEGKAKPHVLYSVN